MFSGSIVALVTPMFSTGEVDWSALESLIEWHIASGTAAIVPMGTTGESATLTPTEHVELVDRCVAIVAKRIPVIGGTGANSTAEAIEFSLAAESSGVDACLLVTPYYNKPPQEGLFQHYSAIAKATHGPLILYNVPSRTACDMSAETVARLAGVANIVGIKESCGDPDRVTEIRNLVPNEFFVLSGEDAQTFAMMELGAVGTISVTANVLPAQMSEFCQLYLAGNRDSAMAADKKLQAMHETLFVETSPIPTKWALTEMGKIKEGIRLPLVNLDSRFHDQVRQCLTTFGALS